MRFILAFAAILAAHVVRADESTAYPVVLQRPLQVGDPLHLEVTLESSQTTKAGGQRIDEESFSHKARMLAHIDIVKVDGIGRPTDVNLREVSLTGELDGVPLEPIPAGAVVVVRRTGAGVAIRMEKDRRSLQIDEQQKMIIEELLSLEGTQPSPDELFGTKKVQRVGGSWPLNIAKLAESIGATGIMVDPEKLRGRAKVVATNRVLGEPCLRIRVGVESKSLDLPLPEGAKVVKGRLSIQLGGDWPIDTTLPRLSEAEKLETSMTIDMPDPEGGSTRLEVSSTNERRASWSPLTQTEFVRNPPTRPSPKLAKASFEGEQRVELEAPWARFAAGAHARYFFFHLPEKKQLVVVDSLTAKVVKTIPRMPDDLLLAASANKLLLVMPSLSMVQRWDIAQLKRESLGPLTLKGEPRLALCGASGDGPLLVASREDVQLIDIETLKANSYSERPIGASGRYGYMVKVGPDGRTFTGITTGITGQRYTVMQVGDRHLSFGRFGSTSYAIRYAYPAGNGSLFLLPGGGVFATHLEPLANNWLSGSTCFPTYDPSYFIAAKCVKSDVHVSVCTVAGREIVHTFVGFNELALRGNTSSRISLDRRFREGEWRFHYMPSAGVFVTLPWGNKEVILRRLDHHAEIAKNEGYLHVTSVPPNVALAGETLRYKPKAISKAGGVKFNVENAPDGVKLDDGELTWAVPRFTTQRSAKIILSATDESGLEVFHTLDLRIPNLFRPTK